MAEIQSKAGASLSSQTLTKELSVLDGLYVLAKHKWLIVLLTILCGVIAGVLALTTPKEYSSTAVLMREAQREEQGGSLAALRGLGLNIGGSQSGLTIEAYPDILASHEVRSVLLEERFTLSTGDRKTFLQYSEEAAPTGLGERISSVFRSSGVDESLPADSTLDSLAVAYTSREQDAMDRMGEMIGVNADAESGLMTVSVTAQDPVLAAAMVGRLVEELQTRVQSLLTQKAREDYEFILGRTREAESDLNNARARLARFDDRNRGLTSAALLAERDRLRQDVGFATEVYSQYQGELKQAEIEVQRASPVITVLDRPVVPLLPVRPRKKVMVFVGLLLGVALGMLAAFLIEGFRAEADTAEGKEKREVIRSAFIPGWFRRKKKPTATEDDSAGSVE